MKTLLKLSLLVVLAIYFTACSSAVKRTKYSDAAHRVMVDPDSINSSDYVRLTNALVSSGKWIVVDRAMGFQAVKKEQERLHQDESDRYDNAQKYAMWGKMYGVGGIIVANAQCQDFQTWSGFLYKKCLLVLTFVDANTSEIIASIDDNYEGTVETYKFGSDWSAATEKLNDVFPKNFEPSKKTAELIQYEQVAKEEALRKAGQ